MSLIFSFMLKHAVHVITPVLQRFNSAFLKVRAMKFFLGATKKWVNYKDAEVILTLKGHIK
jgi:hypothetical protein